METTRNLTLAANFATDWLTRMDGTDLVPDGQSCVVRPQGSKGSTVVLRLTDRQVADLLADARHYADASDDYWDEGMGSLCRSAARVAAAIERQQANG